MDRSKIEWGKEIAQTGSEVAELAKDVGVPGIGLIARFAHTFYEKHLQNRFEKFISDTGIDEAFIEKVISDENYANFLYATLETIRQTHSKAGLIALSLIYKDKWNDEAYLIHALHSFSQISDASINAFISLYESIPENQNYLVLKVKKGEVHDFHDHYDEAIELIKRNFFVMSTGMEMWANGPVQGMKWTHTDSYYSYCKAACSRT